MSKPDGNNQDPEDILIVVSNLYLIALPSLITVGLRVGILILSNVLDVSSLQHTKPHFRVEYFVQGLREGISEHD